LQSSCTRKDGWNIEKSPVTPPKTPISSGFQGIKVMQLNDRFFASLEYRENIEKKRNFVKI